MDSTASEVGRRVRHWRERRNLTRKQFADMVGRSTSWLDKIESGERQLARLPMLELVADTLGIDPSVLTDASHAQRARDCVDATEVQSIRAALGVYPGLSARAGDGVSVRSVQRQATYLDHVWLSSRFAVVAQHLPNLVKQAQQAILVASPDDRTPAHRALVTAYRLASSMLLKFEANDVAWLAADRAMSTAMACR